MKTKPEEELGMAVEKFGRSQFEEGFAVGISVAETAIGWLTQLPDNDRQKQHRQWVLKALLGQCKKQGVKPSSFIEDLARTEGLFEDKTEVAK
jgi:hypothetical protein